MCYLCLKALMDFAPILISFSFLVIFINGQSNDSIIVNSDIAFISLFDAKFIICCIFYIKNKTVAVLSYFKREFCEFFVVHLCI